MNDNADECKRKTAKYYASVLTLVYIVLFPFFFYVALLSSMMFGNPKTTLFIGMSIMFIMFWIPLSIPISIYLMWSRFSQHKYKNTLLWGLLPFFTFAIAMVLVEAIAFLR